MRATATHMHPLAGRWRKAERKSSSSKNKKPKGKATARPRMPKFAKIAMAIVGALGDSHTHTHTGRVANKGGWGKDSLTAAEPSERRTGVERERIR